jgi:hypothetical protein
MRRCEGRRPSFLVTVFAGTRERVGRRSAIAPARGPSMGGIGFALEMIASSAIMPRISFLKREQQ